MRHMKELQENGVNDTELKSNNGRNEITVKKRWDKRANKEIWLQDCISLYFFDKKIRLTRKHFRHILTVKKEDGT